MTIQPLDFIGDCADNAKDMSIFNKIKKPAIYLLIIILICTLCSHDERIGKLEHLKIEESQKKIESLEDDIFNLENEIILLKRKH